MMIERTHSRVSPDIPIRQNTVQLAGAISPHDDDGVHWLALLKVPVIPGNGSGPGAASAMVLFAEAIDRLIKKGADGDCCTEDRNWGGGGFGP